MQEVGLKFGRRLDVHILQLMLNPPTEVAPQDSIEALAAWGRVKQVIVVRHDLGMRRGKQIAQAGTCFDVVPLPSTARRRSVSQ